MTLHAKLLVRAIVFAPLAFSTAALAHAQQDIPNARLRITVQQRENGKINPAYHMQELLCFHGECSLTTITLNSCRPSPMSRGLASPVVIERSSTRERNLKVTNEETTLVAVESGSDIGGSYSTTQRFTYEKTRPGETALNLIGYSGGFVKNSVVSKEVLTVDFIPLKEAKPGVGYAEINLTCPLGIPALTVPLFQGKSD